MSRIERILQRPLEQRSAPRTCLTATLLLTTALGLSLAGAWACSTSAPDAAADPSPATPGSAPAAADALAIRWLPPALDQWKPALTATAQRYGLDPALLAVVTLVESLGDASAHSPSGAIGLMQIMPTTAAEIASERQLRGYSEERLWDPAYNMDLGAWYLSRQLTSFGGAEGATARAIELAAVAYNGGPKLANAYQAGALALPEPIQEYRDLVLGLWNEREQSESPTYSAWQERLRLQEQPGVPR